MPNTSEGFDQVEASASPEHAVNVVKFESVQSDPAPRRPRLGLIRFSHHALTVAAHHGARRKQLPSKVLIMRRRTPALADNQELHARGSTPSDASVICRTTVYKYGTKNNGT